MGITAKDIITFSENNEVKDGTLERYNDKDSYVVLPDEIKQISQIAFMDNNNIKAVFLPSAIRYIFDGYREESVYEDEEDKLVGAFSGCMNLEKVIMSEKLKSIPAMCFSNCLSLKEVKVYEGITNIGMMAFYNCVQMNVLRIPNSLETIQMYAFYNCYGLEYIFIPKSVKYIGKYAFSGLTNEQTIIFECSEKDSLNFHANWRGGCYSRVIWNYRTRD